MREVILEIGAEGGSLTLYGIRGSDGLRKYYLFKNSAALHDLLSDESFDEEAEAKSHVVTSWDKAVALLEKHPHWYRLSPLQVHPEFLSRVLEKVELSGGLEDVSIWRKKLDLPAPIKPDKAEHPPGIAGKGSLITQDMLRALYERYLELVGLEIEQFGVAPTEVRHLIGRLGEFYCALAVGGTLASTANQHGFDVISSDGRRVSVKATAQKTGFVPISASTAGLAHDLMIVQYQTGVLSAIFYGSMQVALNAARHYPEKGRYELDIGVAKGLLGKSLVQ